MQTPEEVCIITNGFPSNAAFAYDAQASALIHVLRQIGVKRTHIVNVAWIDGDCTPRFDDASGAILHPSPASQYPCNIPPHAFQGPWSLIITLVDVVVFAHGAWPCRAVAWFPAHYLAPTEHEARVLGSFDVVLPMTHHAADSLRRAGLKNVSDTVCYNIVDPTLAFRRLEPPQMNEPFTFLCIAMNYESSQRKGHAALLAAFRTFLDHGGRARLILHAPSNANGIDLHAVVRALALHNDVVLSLGLIEAPADLMRLAHVLIAPSKAEGFGVPVAEAQIAARPVIVTDFGAMAEIARVGVKVPPATLEWNAAQGGFWAVPDVRGLAAAMRSVQDGFLGFRDAAVAARDSIANDASVAAAIRHWTSVLQRLLSQDKLV